MPFAYWPGRVGHPLRTQPFLPKIRRGAHHSSSSMYVKSTVGSAIVDSAPPPLLSSSKPGAGGLSGASARTFRQRLGQRLGGDSARHRAGLVLHWAGSACRPGAQGPSISLKEVRFPGRQAQGRGRNQAATSGDKPQQVAVSRSKPPQAAISRIKARHLPSGPGPEAHDGLLRLIAAYCCLLRLIAAYCGLLRRS